MPLKTQNNILWAAMAEDGGSDMGKANEVDHNLGEREGNARADLELEHMYVV